MIVKGTQTRHVEVDVTPQDALKALKRRFLEKWDLPVPRIAYDSTYINSVGSWEQCYDTRYGIESEVLREAFVTEQEVWEALVTLEDNI